MTITPRRLVSADDAAVWLAPFREGSGAAPVLRFTAPTGQQYEVQLTAGDVERIRDTAGAICDADTRTVDGWLNDTARAIVSKVDSWTPSILLGEPELDERAATATHVGGPLTNSGA